MDSQFEVRDLFAAHIMAAMITGHFCVASDSGGYRRRSTSPESLDSTSAMTTLRRYAIASFMAADAMNEIRNLNPDDLSNMLLRHEPDSNT